jgi:cytochrome bd ubiquinol oxidase subunit II
VITGWGVGQYPWMLVDEVTINDAAGASSTLIGLLVVVAIAGVVVLPALGYLLWLTQTEAWTRR